ncbi:uncharacterized protein LOC119326310 [Triticum dicoccoides]|uniref:Protein kinase domain-containing protein n=2 Tax=Triticum turgidum subsp. durum TaxID=4567 RepID=A0A9R0Z0D5_TRITD|nr:uncharacterized protein LOC119326310 [Triticum dicoccoides]VAI63733.1 unnamed protein product [Triticum turgidum subsp. durum]
MNNIAEMEALERVFSDASAKPIKLSYGLLEIITENFSNEIGRGGFGVVYKGYLRNGEVAVKKLSNPHALPDRKFLDEITCLKKAKHINIVRILGYCSETQGELLEINEKHIMAEIQKKLICFEYVPNGNIQHYLKQERHHGDDWHVRYQMIVGICQGLHYLHEKYINHLDLKPENVLLDADMKPKVTDFGLSRCLDQGQSIITQNILGTPRYIAPEIIDKGEISFKSDIYAFGIITIELLTGISKANLDNWDKLLDMDCPRMRRCIEIARKCTDPDKRERPTAREVIRDLDELESMVPWSSMNQVTPTVVPGNEVLDVYPLELRFPFVPNKEMRCHLTTTTKTDCFVFCMLVPGVPDRYSGDLVGIVPGMCTSVTPVVRQAEEELPSGTDELEVLFWLTGCNDPDKLALQLSALSVYPGSPSQYELKAAFHELGWELHRTTLTAVVVAPEDDDLALVVNTPCKEEEFFYSIDCMDVHPTEPWVAIFAKNRKGVYLWNWQTNEKIGECNSGVDILGSDCDGEMLVTKFISRKQWVVIGNSDGFILVCTCPSMDQVTHFKAHRDSLGLLAVHPTRPFLLSCNNMKMKIWDWNRGWSCIGKIHSTSRVTQVMFNPRNTNDFATHHHDGIVKMWRIDHPDPVGTTHRLHDMYETASSSFTYTGDRYFIAAIHNSKNVALTIWDLQKEEHVYTLTTDEVTVAAVCHPTLPVLVTVSNGGTIHVWDSTTYRLKKVYENCPKDPIHIGFTGSERLVIGHSKGISVLDIDLE